MKQRLASYKQLWQVSKITLTSPADTGTVERIPKAKDGYWDTVNRCWNGVYYGHKSAGKWEMEEVPKPREAEDMKVLEEGVGRRL
jgi:hypothetical protein